MKTTLKKYTIEEICKGFVFDANELRHIFFQIMCLTLS
jgi:hypothetical protein